jgi:hypothetical protein
MSLVHAPNPGDNTIKFGHAAEWGQRLLIQKQHSTGCWSRCTPLPASKQHDCGITRTTVISSFAMLPQQLADDADKRMERVMPLQARLQFMKI